MPSTFSGGDKLDALLAGRAANLQGINTVSVGFLENATYPDGTSVAAVAALNEFGGTITVPAHTVQVFRKLLKNGSFAKGGQFVNKNKSNFMTEHTVAAYTVTIPSRPFFRQMLIDVKPELGPLIAHLTQTEDYKMEVVLRLIGEFMKGKLQDSIQNFTTPPNAKSTIKAKGFDHPLIDTGHMQNSADYEVGTE